MLKKQLKNKGYTLVELIVSIAILAFIGIAIGGLMSSNTVVFRKSKSELEVQTVAQDSYSRLSNDIMQAKSIYIEGYKPGATVEFGNNTVGGNSSISVDESSRGYFLSDTDVNLISKYSGTVPDGNTLETTYNSTMSKEERNKFNTYYYKLRYMTDEERTLYSSFISCIPSGVAYSSFETLKKYKSDGTGSVSKYEFDDIYVTKFIISYLTPYEAKYDSSSNAPAGTTYDNCTVTYTFDNAVYNSNGAITTKADKALVHIKTEYDYMDDIESDDTFTDMINYRKSGDTIVPGVVVNVDSNNNAIGLKMYFAKALATGDNGRKYNSEGIITFRNSNVVKNAK